MEVRSREIGPLFDRVTVDFHGSTLRPDQQDSQKGLVAVLALWVRPLENVIKANWLVGWVYGCAPWDSNPEPAD